MGVGQTVGIAELPAGEEKDLVMVIPILPLRGYLTKPQPFSP